MEEVEIRIQSSRSARLSYPDCLEICQVLESSGGLALRRTVTVSKRVSGFYQLQTWHRVLRSLYRANIKAFNIAVRRCCQTSYGARMSDRQNGIGKGQEGCFVEPMSTRLGSSEHKVLIN